MSLSSPIGVSSETGFRPYEPDLLDLLGRDRRLGVLRQDLSAISAFVGSRPSWTVSSRDVRVTRFIVSTMWTGIRIVRDWSARPRWIAWRIHHVA